MVYRFARMNTKSLKFIDLFSGCGGFSTGLEMAGHKCLLGVDFNADAIKSFAHNHYESQTYCGDIRDLTAAELKKLLGKNKVDMVVGGPPCQGFSTVGKGMVEDERNQLFLEFVRIVRELKPKVIMLENVTGMLASKNRKTLMSIFEQFESLGFNMDARVMAAEEYGVPSRRRRTIIMGVRGGKCLWPEFSHGPRGKAEFTSVKEAWSNLKSLDGSVFNHDISRAKPANELDLKRLACIPEGAGIRYEKDQKNYLPKKLWFDVDFESMREKRFRQTRLQRLSRSKPAPTILTSRTMYYHPTQDRYLTVREAAACQSFPNEFEFLGSQTSQFRQIGNAVPPFMAMALGKAVSQISLVSRTKKTKFKHSEFTQKAFNYNHLTKAI